MLVIDDRENEKVIERVKRRLGENTTVKRLSVGDYIIGDCAVEAKEINDLYRSIMGFGRTRTIISQLVDLQESFSNPMLVVYGTVLKPYIKGRHDPQAIARERERMDAVIRHFKHTFYHRFPKIRYMEVKSMDEFVDWLVTNHTQMDIVGAAKESEKTAGIIPMGELDPRVAVLASLQGVSPKTAKALLKKFGSIPKILAHRTTQKSLMEINGIGRKRAREILALRNIYEV